MPKRIPTDTNLVLSLFKEVKSGREVARRLKLHENTVYAILKREKGLCPICSLPSQIGRKYCTDCLQHIAARQKQKRLARRKLGLCESCNDPYELPSRRFCKKHWLQNNAQRQRIYDAKKEKRGAPLKGIPNQSQREKHIQNKYGLAAVEIWRELNASCVLCGVAHSQSAIHIHHIDCNDQNHVKENLTLLCFKCHQMVHLFIQHPFAQKTAEWLKATYPSLY